MKNSNLQKFFLIIAGIWLASCGGFAPPDSNVNLPQKQNTNIPAATPAASATPIPTVTIEETPIVMPTATSTPINYNTATNSNLLANSPVSVNVNSANSNISTVAMDKLIIPVAGIKPESLRDTFKDARSEGRVHDAIDIMAPGGSPVLAAADGEIARFFDSEKGGITIYQFSRDKKLMYYYAHLQRRADEIQEHQFVRQGTVIGYVGDTGNAGPGNFHLHFAIWTVDDPKHYWDGTNIDPYPLLR